MGSGPTDDQLVLPDHDEQDLYQLIRGNPDTGGLLQVAAVLQLRQQQGQESHVVQAGSDRAVPGQANLPAVLGSCVAPLTLSHDETTLHKQ